MSDFRAESHTGEKMKGSFATRAAPGLASVDYALILVLVALAAFTTRSNA